jgi:hypothetical protein
MNGNKWNKAIKLCVALAKATSMLENIHVTISFRSTYNKLPYIMIAYDSSVDKFEKIKNLFPYLKSEGTTPEGLCYEALLSRLPENNSETNSYFINISDGEPFFMTKIDKVDIHYSDEPAAAHTRSQVKKIRNAGYNVISYFISEYNDPGSKTSNIFRKMYGDDSNFINTDSMNQILNTLNKKMLDAVDIS